MSWDSQRTEETYRFNHGNVMVFFIIFFFWFTKHLFDKKNSIDAFMQHFETMVGAYIFFVHRYQRYSPITSRHRTHNSSGSPAVQNMPVCSTIDIRAVFFATKIHDVYSFISIFPGSHGLVRLTLCTSFNHFSEFPLCFPNFFT